MAGKECEILVIRHARETACPPCRPRPQPPRRALALAVNRRRAGQGPRFRSSRRPERGMPLRPSLVSSQASFPSRIRAATDAPRILDQPGRKASAPRTGPRIRVSPQCWGSEKARCSTTFRVFAREGRPGSFRPATASLRPGQLVAARTRGGCREGNPVRFRCRRLPPASGGPATASFVHARTSPSGWRHAGPARRLGARPCK